MFFDPRLYGSYELAILLKLFLAALAGGFVGWERERRGRPAGLRTNLLVSVGACTVMIISETFFLKYGAHNAESLLRLDPSRTAAQIVTGIGFLGAGVILKEGATVRGLTTAATLWVVAGLGMAFGMGFFSLGALSTITVLVGLLFLKQFDLTIKKDRYLYLSVTARRRDSLYDDLLQLVDERGLKISEVSSQVDLENNELLLRMVLKQRQDDIGRELARAIEQFEGIKKIHYR
ncbi:MAG: MgtC/SapB family protein [Deltaproteobacteria bacterium]|jgi:putative Mg2+ transporter-C (MgtC) family protein|nr:MAG: MgtC/SapB family protein [Deltaproteobacteria bacterium]